ncbi:putative ATP-dependent endonuclease of OLD family [Silvimonas terrae]|uniref:Putative ATP-dependent endonuclease of OLD family n=1 Tax=Silvimonas terrae TaxID=300266 RepID=A0A840RDT5_9NEIS|nr:AAA family ATPase [Silvimonas terrae]MBB5190688.1 putative ATP-dependent endonuclease of OLD family [Silvimonas terrae]
MRIKTIAIENLRSIKSAAITFDPYICLVGPNGAGKSTVLCALNLFFRETENATTDLTSLTEEDFHLCDTSEPIRVTVTFHQLNDAAQADFSDYFRHGELTIKAVATFDVSTGRATVKHYGQRMAMAAFSPFFKALGDSASAAELKALYAGIRAQFGDLPSATTKDAMAGALHDYEGARPELCEPLDSEDQFYGASKGSNLLARYVQWIYVPAVKDASQEQQESKNTALGKLLARTVRTQVNFADSVGALLHETRARYSELLAQQQETLGAISRSLSSRISQWAHPEAEIKLSWQQDVSKAVKVDEPFARVVAGEAGFEGDLARFGHGFQRSYLLALLQELAGADQAEAPTLLLGCEEPELYQHPPQARHLASVLSSLAEGNAQIMVTTHSPYFVSGEHFENVRMVRMDAATRGSTIHAMTPGDLAARFAAASGEPLPKRSAPIARAHQALQTSLCEMFFTQRLVLVEGLEDIAYIHTWLALTGQIEQYRRKGIHIVATQGKSLMARPLIVAQDLKIPVFVIFDADGDRTKQHERPKHEFDNRTLLNLLGVNPVDPFPAVHIDTPTHTVWVNNLGDAVNGELKAVLGVAGYDDLSNKVNAFYGHDGDLNKNTLLIGTRLAMAFEEGIRIPVLEQLCARILDMDNVPVA